MKEIKTKRYRLYHGDCLGVMPTLKEHSVSLIISDPPYGTTNCKWDSIINLDKMWENYLRLAKNDKTPILLFANMQFAVELINSNRKMFKYEWIWRKSRSGSAFTAKYCPIRIHEYILIFCKSSANYFPIMEAGQPYSRRQTKRMGENNHGIGVNHNGGVVNEGTRFPITIREFKQDWSRQQQVHPTQKPVNLLEYLIKTYSKENDIVLDNTMGSGATGIACVNTKRRFIGIEQDAQYFKLATGRIANAMPPLLANI